MEKTGERIVLCGANAYEQKYYYNETFNAIPASIKEELHIICVLFTEEVGGIFTVAFEADGNIVMETAFAPEDYLYDEIGSVLKVKDLQRSKTELLESLEMFYRIIILGEFEEE